MAIIKYVQSQYEAKIAELEQYYILLQQHLNKMESLKENMFQFWDDDNARQAGQVLTLTIRQVTSSMTMTQETLAFYKSAVAKLGARAQVLNRTQELHAVALFLQRIVRRGRALDRDAVGLELERLLGVRREHELAVHDERRADVLAGDLVVIFELAALEHDLQALEAAAVVELDKAEILHVADRARPAADGQGLANFIR